MGRFSQLKNRVLGKPRLDGGSNGGGGVSYASATPPTAPVLPSASAPASASKVPLTPATIENPPPEQVGPPVPQRPKPTPVSPTPQAAISPTAGAARLSPSHEEVDPWGRAYIFFQEREPELAADYAKHLSSLQREPAASIDLSAARSVESVVKQLLKDREEKQWRVSLLGREVKIRDQVEKLSKFLLWSDPIVKNALSAQPYAALAWAGVSVLLPLLTTGTTANEAMLNGFNSIGDLQIYWQICEDTYLQSEYQQHYQRLVEPLAKLYSYIVEYQARVVCHLSRAQLSRAWQNVAGWNDWDRAAAVDELSKECSACIGHLNEGEIRERWKCQLQEMQQSRTILDEIRRILEVGGRHTQRIYDDQKERDLLHDIASDYEGFKNFNPQKVEGTCEWFFNDERFRKWRDNNTSSLLWVSAGPGCGKSVLSRALIDGHWVSTSVTTSTVCHFFFKDGVEGRMHSTNALCAILHQLFTQDPAGSLIGLALPGHKNHGEKLTRNFSELWRILLECARSPDSGEVVCVLDALDECDRYSRGELIDKIKDFYSKQDDTSNRSSRLKFLITSRPYDDLEASFRKFSGVAEYLHFDGDDKSEQISQEINLVIDARVHDIADDFTSEDRRAICERLKNMEHRTYLWLHLTFDIIKQSPSEYGRRTDIETLLSELPSQISEAYENILGRSKDGVQTEILLRIVLAAGRPLDLDEANIALTSALQKTEIASLSDLESQLWPRGNFQSIVKNLCGLFVNVYDSKLFFIHQTAREFLVNPKRKGKWEGRLSMPKAHSTMSLVCIHYLLLPDHSTTLEDSPGRQEDLFAPYAATHWPLHFTSQEDIIADESRRDARTLCRMAGGARVWAFHSSLAFYHQWKYWTDLHLASYFGLWLVVEDILVEMKLNTQDEVFGTALQGPLYLASLQGYEKVVKLLLDNGADVNIFGGSGPTALYTASENGHKDVVKLLLDNGADVNIVAEKIGTALQAASEECHKDVVKLLLDNGADVNIVAGKLGTALQAASLGSDKEIVKLLLDNGADVNIEAGTYGTALQAASLHSDKEIVKLLLDNGADVNIEAGTFGSALLGASLRGDKEIVKLLLDNGADVNIGNISTALQAASLRGDKEIVKLLLDRGVDTKSRTYDLAIVEARGKGHEEIVKILLDKRSGHCAG